MSTDNVGIGPQRFQELQSKFEPKKQESDSPAQVGKSTALHSVSRNGIQLQGSDKVHMLAFNSRSSTNLVGKIDPAMSGNGGQKAHIELTAAEELAGSQFSSSEYEDTLHQIEGLKDQLAMIKLTGADDNINNSEQLSIIRDMLDDVIEDFKEDKFSSTSLQDVRTKILDLNRSLGPLGDADTKLALRELADEVSNTEQEVDKIIDKEEALAQGKEPPAPTRSVSSLVKDRGHIAEKAKDADFSAFETFLSFFSSEKAELHRENRIQGLMDKVDENYSAGNTVDAAKNLIRLAKASPELYQEKLASLKEDKTALPTKGPDGLTNIITKQDVINEACKLAKRRLLDKHITGNNIEKRELYIKMILQNADDTTAESLAGFLTDFHTDDKNTKQILVKLLADPSCNQKLIPHAEDILHRTKFKVSDFNNDTAQLNQFVGQVMSNHDMSLEDKLSLLEKIPPTLIEASTLDSILKDEHGDIKDNAFEIASHFVSKEIRQETGDALFRNRTVGSQMLSHYLDMVGGDWADTIMDGLQADLMQKEAEVDARLNQDFITNQIETPIKERLIQRLESGPITKDELTTFLKEQREIRNILGDQTDAFVDKLTMGLQESFTNASDINGAFGRPFMSNLKKFAMQGIASDAALQVFTRMEESFSADSDNPVPQGVIDMFQVLNQSGKDNARQHRAKPLKDQQVESFSNFDMTTAMLRMLNPRLTGSKGSKSWGADASTPKSVLLASTIVQTVANRTGSASKYPAIVGKRDSMQETLQAKYDELSPPTLKELAHRQKDWTLAGVKSSPAIYQEMAAYHRENLSGEPFDMMDDFDAAESMELEQLQQHYEMMVGKYFTPGGEKQINLKNRELKKIREHIASEFPSGNLTADTAKEFHDLLVKIVTGTNDGKPNALTFPQLFRGMSGSYKSHKGV